MDESFDGFDRLRPVSLLARSGCSSRLEVVVAIRQPMEPDRRREVVAGNFFLAAKRITGALEDERRRLEGRKVLDTKLIRLADRMKRVAEADQARDIPLVS